MKSKVFAFLGPARGTWRLMTATSPRPSRAPTALRAFLVYISDDVAAGTDKAINKIIEPLTKQRTTKWRTDIGNIVCDGSFQPFSKVLPAETQQRRTFYSSKYKMAPVLSKNQKIGLAVVMAIGDSISAKQRLVVTLRFLATGNSYQDLKYSSLISQPMLSIIIPETCSAIYTCLEHYIKIWHVFIDFDYMA
ncbi:hypothetical protein HW555_003155 [Spodoptera exigua]|uniref:Uncharacterized protein n=1 Tax=Spodoptera exigua TaxID=7107 RepID=A0A835GLN4_SPOEX|nr:hypothetical protein HW555_003155 [Spodoptera exigua]